MDEGFSTYRYNFSRFLRPQITDTTNVSYYIDDKRTSNTNK